MQSDEKKGRYYPLNESDLYHIRKHMDEKDVTNEFLEMRQKAK